MQESICLLYYDINAIRYDIIVGFNRIWKIFCVYGL